MQKVRNQGGAIITRELMFDGIPDQAWKLYAWLKEVADGQLNASGQDRKPGSRPPPVSTGILPQYRDRTMAAPSDKAPHATEQKNRQSMTHVGIITECYRPREVRLRPPPPSESANAVCASESLPVPWSEAASGVQTALI
ncbi:hypothetical protein J3738_003681 [Salmonella enterica]|nr:hypothetical protein [Salmonella enterica]